MQSNSLINISNKNVIIPKAGMYYIKALRQLFFNTLCHFAQLVIDTFSFLLIPPS